jgi:light-harvesting protein B-800-850 alpha chain
MNNAKMWLVVPPAVGVPVFLGAVAVGSFAVHVAVVTNTSWVSDYLSGQELGTGDAMAAAAALEGVNTAKAAYAADTGDGTRELTVILPDGTVAKAVLQTHEVMASAGSPLLSTD